MALIGGIIGAVDPANGPKAIQLGGLEKVLLALFVSPVVSLVAAYLFTKLVFFLARQCIARINKFCQRSGKLLPPWRWHSGQSTNEAQKTDGRLHYHGTGWQQVVTGSIPGRPSGVIVLSLR